MRKYLLASLNEAEKRKWIGLMQSLDMKKNGRKAWKLLSRLEGKHTKSLSGKSQAVSSILVRHFRIIIDKIPTKRVKKDIQNLIKTC